MFNEVEVEKLCGGTEIYWRARRFQVTGAVSEVRVAQAEKAGFVYLEGEVTEKSGERLHVWIRCREDMERAEDYGCECGDFLQHSGMCSHCAALALKFLEQKRFQERMGAYRASLRKDVDTNHKLLAAMEDYAMYRRQQEQAACGTIELEPTLLENGWNYYYGRKRFSLSFRIGAVGGRKYTIKNLQEFVWLVRREEYHSYGKKLAFVHSKGAFTESGWEYVQLILMAAKLRTEKNEPLENVMPVNLAVMERFLDLNLGKTIPFFGREYSYRELHIRDENPPLRLKLSRGKEGFYLLIPPVSMWQGNAHLYVRMDEMVYRCSEAYRISMERILECANKDGKTVLKISEGDMMAFCTSVLPELEKQEAVETGKLTLEHYKPGKAELVFYLDEEDGQVKLKAESRYGDRHFLLTESQFEDEKELHPNGGGQESYRDRMKEQHALDVASAYFPYMQEKYLYFASEDSDRMYQLLDTGIRQLEELGKVYATDRIKARRLVRSVKTQVGISLQSGLLELSVSSGEFTEEELEEILQSIRKKKRYYRLKSGDFLKLDSPSSATIAELFEGLECSPKDMVNGAVRVPKFRAWYIDRLLRDSGSSFAGGEEGNAKAKSQEKVQGEENASCPPGTESEIQVCQDAACRALIRQLEYTEQMGFRVPESLSGTLREYQKAGYRWMRTLAQLGFGGILADDMGLGKTLQTITYFLARRQEGIAKKPGLIICPASLLYNWKKEFEQFAPELSVRLITGSASQRALLLAGRGTAGKAGKAEADTRTFPSEDGRKGTAGEAEESEKDSFADVWITSYDLIRRDVELYRELSFDTEVLDEAQNIKNRGTQTARSVRSIRSDVRFALTGTPIENRLSELWSIFDYLMPGLLGSGEKFRKNYEQPIMQDGDSHARERLKRLVTPFILRRMKQDVLTELPEKLEQTVYARLEEEQRKLYAAHVRRLRKWIAGKSGEEIHQQKLQILSELTQLRQICCDPGLLYETYTRCSCKVATCMELIRQAVSGKHKTLIFSQFTSVFPILEEQLEKEQILYYKLTGSTPKEERQRLTEAFNTDDVPVFLISLKAGGTGLNLTAASIVIHFDPWWNLAAQNQATDRAHRIGQKNRVTVLKLIAQDTIEERILALQEQKQQLAQGILEGEGLSAASLSKEDLMEILNM